MSFTKIKNNFQKGTFTTVSQVESLKDKNYILAMCTSIFTC